MKNLSSKMKRALTAQESGEVAAILLTINHPTLSEPVRLSNDPTVLLSIDPLRYGTVSRGQTFTFFPFSIQLPDDSSERAPVATIAVANVERELIGLIRGTSKRGTITIELVLASSPNYVERAFPVFDLTGVSYNADTITLSLSMDSYTSEPYPAGSFNPASFPGLF